MNATWLLTWTACWEKNKGNPNKNKNKKNNHFRKEQKGKSSTTCWIKKD